jgi:hypothetical protein
MPASGESTMQAKTKFSFLASFFAFALSLGLAAAQAQDMGVAQAARSAQPKAAPKTPAKPYFVEFRSRSALTYGHAFLVHGRLNAQGQVGQVTKEQVVGFHPFTDSSIPWSIGHVVPVPAEHGFSDGDIEDEYITARYRVLLTEAEYRETVAFMDHLKENSPLWHAVLYNCAAYIGDVAKHMGLKTPSPLQYPDEFITQLAELNGGKVVLLQDTLAQQAAAKPAAKPMSTAAKPAAAKPAAAKPAAPKPAVDPSAPSAANPALKPTAVKPAAKRTATAATPAAAAQPEPVRQ